VIVSIAALAAGLLVLFRAADAFVLGASRVSRMLKLSPVVVGAIVLGFGTSAPELLVSALAAAQGSPEIAYGNIVGSNVANVTLVAGLAALVAGRIAIASATIRREAPLAALAVIGLAAVLQGSLSRWVGLALLVAFVAAMAWIVLGAARDGAITDEAVEEVPTTGRREAVRTLAGLLGTALGAQLVVRGATGVADALNLDEGFVGLTIVAVGTSLPEVVTAVQAARLGQSHLAVGNLFGSNLFNSLAIGGTVALIAPGPLESGAVVGLGAVTMVVAGLVAWLLLGTGRALVRWEAAVLLAAYLALLPFLAR